MQWDIVIQTEQEQKTFSSVRDYNRADFDKIRGQLQNINWDELLERDTVEEAWDSFTQLLYVTEETYIPMKTSPRCHRRKPLWLTNSAVKAIRHKHNVYRKYKRKDHPACKLASRETNKAVHNAKANYEKKLAQNIKIDNKSFFAYVRSKSKAKVKAGPLLADTGQVVDSPQELAEEFNE